MSNELRLGIAGLGTVGAGVVKIVEKNSDILARKCGRGIAIAAVSARSRSKQRGIEISGYAWEDDPVALARRNDIDVFIELIGGENGSAKASVEAALDTGKHVVTANKAMLAVHGQYLAELAEKHRLALRFEAAVAGGIPVVKVLSESMAANRVKRVLGVMNGTCNYILTRMESSGLSYEEVFAEANGLGYLEADPSLDVGGIDSGHKLALLASIAFGTRVDFESMDIEGIDRVSITDIEQARDMGFRIKLLGVAKLTGKGLEQRTQPCLVPADSPLGRLENATNMIVIEGDASGQIFLQGAGAGEGPTSSSVLSDVVELARGQRATTFGQPAASLVDAKPVCSDLSAPFYLRMTLKDEPGVLALIASVLGDAGISIDRMRQYKHEGEAAPVIMVTHRTSPAEIAKAISRIKTSGAVLEDPVSIRIEEI
ncbi:MAG: homoserine dehydrogenase [Albidovulum sp.]|nr:homoserine dehydrogenase [Albidovulum sp.]